MAEAVRGRADLSDREQSTSNRAAPRGLREAGLIAIAALALFCMLALITHDAGDPGWSHTGPNTQAVNAGGTVGAWIADVLFYLFGYLGYFFPLAVAWGGWLWFRRGVVSAANSSDPGPLAALSGFAGDLPPQDVYLTVVQVCGALLTLFAGCGLASMHFDATGMPLDAGGVLGSVIGHHLGQALGLVGCTLVLLSAFLTGCSLFTGLSWLSMIDSVGWVTLRICRVAHELSITVNRFFQAHARNFQPLAKQFGEIRRTVGARASSSSRAQRREPAVGLPDTIPQSEPVLDYLAPSTSPRHADDDEEDGFQTFDSEPKPVRAARRAPISKPQIGAAIAAPEQSVKVVQAKAKARQSALFEELIGDEELPPLTLLDEVSQRVRQISADALEAISRQVELKLADFGIEVEVVAVHPGPVVTRYELQPAPGLKVSKIITLSKDLARSLSTMSVRIVEVIPGKSTIGLEIPNEERELVQLGEILGSKEYADKGNQLSLALGKDIGGHPSVVNLGRMPHLLVAGTTGSGKSVAVNAMILSILFKSSPQDVRLIMIDPKMLELSVYDGIPHLLAPVVTDMTQASNALRWCVGEMERRYKLMSALGVRNLAGFNRKVSEATQNGEPIPDPMIVVDPGADLSTVEVPVLEPMPHIVVVVDELADLMMVTKKKCEELIARLAQKARAAGIHLILATQRPSVDVITGLIKANVPSRIAFQVSSKVDSRTIIDQMGAESLLGHGDMLYLGPGMSQPQRVHGAFVDDHEVHQVAEYLRSQGEPQYIEDVLRGPELDSEEGGGLLPDMGSGAEEDPLYDQAVRIVTETRRASISGVQRRLKIGYNRAARMLEQMEMSGVVGALQPNGAREVLAPPPPKD